MAKPPSFLTRLTASGRERVRFEDDIFLAPKAIKLFESRGWFPGRVKKSHPVSGAEYETSAEFSDPNHALAFAVAKYRAYSAALKHPNGLSLVNSWRPVEHRFNSLNELRANLEVHRKELNRLKELNRGKIDYALVKTILRNARKQRL